MLMFFASITFFVKGCTMEAGASPALSTCMMSEP